MHFCPTVGRNELDIKAFLNPHCGFRNNNCHKAVVEDALFIRFKINREKRPKAKSARAKAHALAVINDFIHFRAVIP